ncbi:MAG: hypothetical protein WC726_02910 [Parcubacteria group bacterium]|jgi:hypothetical protein
MARLILNEVKTCRKKERVLKTFFLTDKEAEEYFGDDNYIREKVRLALRRTEPDELRFS